MAHFDAGIKDLLVSEAIASETTAATFFATASSKEIQIFNESGGGIPTGAGNFFFLQKKADGTVKRSDTIYGPNILSAVKTVAVTSVPEYSYFTVSTTGTAVGDVVEVYHWYLATESVADWKFKTIPYTITTNTAVEIAKGVSKQIIRNLQEDFYYNNRPQTVFNLAGYVGVYATEAAAEAAVGGLTDGDLVWVISNEKPYTVAKSGGTTFADDFDEKTSWTAELGNGSAVYVNQPAFYDVVLKNASGTYSIYICNKAQARVLDKFEGLASKNKWGVTVKDATTGFETLNEWAVTKVGEAINPTSGKRLGGMEAHLDKLTRQFGGYNYQEFPFVPDIVATTDYCTLTITYKEADTYGDHKIAGRDLKSTIVIAFDASADADTILALVNTAKNGPALTIGDLPAISLNALSDVVITSGTTGDVIQLAADGNWKNVAADV